MCYQYYVICFNNKKLFVIIVYPRKDSIIRQASYNFYSDKDWF